VSESHHAFTDQEIAAVRDLLHRTWFAIQAAHAQLGADVYSLQLGDLRVLKLIEEHPDAIMRDIRDALGVPHSTLTGVIDRLERNGLVRRTLSDRDRRSYGLVLTEDGERLQREHEQADHELAVHVLEAIAEAGDKKLAVELLERIVERLA